MMIVPGNIRSAYLACVGKSLKPINTICILAFAILAVSGPTSSPAHAHGGWLKLHLSGVEIAYRHPQVVGTRGTVTVAIYTFAGNAKENCVTVFGDVVCYPRTTRYLFDKMPRKIQMGVGSEFEVYRQAPQIFHLRAAGWTTSRSKIMWLLNTNTGDVIEEYYADLAAKAFGNPYRSPTSSKTLDGVRVIGVSPAGFRISINGGQIHATINTESAGPYEIELGPKYLRRTVSYSALPGWRLTRAHIHTPIFKLASPNPLYWWTIDADQRKVWEHFSRFPQPDEGNPQTGEFGSEDVIPLNLQVEERIMH